MQRPNSILIVEDAENIIRDRQHDNFLPSQAVANLLNLSDGLLGDAMQQQIICTFNCDVKGIDPALLREGRLVVEHKLDRLSVANARRMCVEFGIPGNGEDIQEPITLAEIYARKKAAVETEPNGSREGSSSSRTRSSAFILDCDLQLCIQSRSSSSRNKLVPMNRGSCPLLRGEALALSERAWALRPKRKSIIIALLRSESSGTSGLLSSHQVVSNFERHSVYRYGDH